MFGRKNVRRDSSSPMGAYLTGSGGMPPSNPRTAAILADAQQIHEDQQRTVRRVEANTDVPWPPADPNQWLTRQYGTAINEQRSRRQAELSNQDARTQTMRADREWVLSHCDRGAASDYAAWLHGFIARGGKPSHVYDYPTPVVWVANTSFALRPLYGALSIGLLLVPKHVTVEAASAGHTEVYRMEAFATDATVPVYSDSFAESEH